MQMQFIQFYLSRPLGGHMMEFKRAEVCAGGGRGGDTHLNSSVNVLCIVV